MAEQTLLTIFDKVNFLFAQRDALASQWTVSSETTNSDISTNSEFSLKNYEWTLLNKDSNVEPQMRGGHSMICDDASNRLILFGGWNGKTELDDFWIYSLEKQQWTKITKKHPYSLWPSSRSCHKLCYCSTTHRLYLLGKYMDTTTNSSPQDYRSDFYFFDFESMEWTLISENTATKGGPKLLYDHQMVIDEVKQKIYVFGGKILQPSNSSNSSPTPTTAASSTTTTNVSSNSTSAAAAAPPSLFILNGGAFAASPLRSALAARAALQEQTLQQTLYSGFFVYDIKTNTWSNIRIESLVPRIAHSMLFCSVTRQILLFGGVTSLKESCRNFTVLDIDQEEMFDLEIMAGKNIVDTTIHEVHRITYDPELQMIHLFSGNLGPLDKSQVRKYASFQESKLKEEEEEAKSKSHSYEKSSLLNTFWIGKVFAQPNQSLRRGTRIQLLKVFDLDQLVYYNYFSLGNCSYNMETIIKQQQETEIVKNNLGLKTEPAPRYAYTFVYSSKTKNHFLFAGNAGTDAPNTLRLNDFWKLQFTCATQPTTSIVASSSTTTPKSWKDVLLNKCLFMLRMRKVKEDLKYSSTIRLQKETFQFIHTKIKPLIQSQLQEEQVQQLLELFIQQPLQEETKDLNKLYQERLLIYDELMSLIVPSQNQHSLLQSNGIQIAPQACLENLLLKLK